MRIISLFVLLMLCLSVYGKKLEEPKNLPDSITAYGRITAEGKPLEGVIVSDGALFTKTDRDGYYMLASKKYQNVVFYITPSGYEPEMNKKIFPKFWATLSHKKDFVDRHDFSLRKVNNLRHRMVVSADAHLCGRSEDIIQIKRMFIPNIQRELQRAKRDSVSIYSIVLGDLSVCSAWYSADFDIGDAMKAFSVIKYPLPLFTVMGEQDYDGAVPCEGLTDYKAERMYVYECGPKYYSMNIGDIHYIVLDNTLFLNEPGDGHYPTDIVGKRNYETLVSIEQLDWLRNDLSFVPKDKTIVVFMHHPVFRTGGKSGNIIKAFSKREQTDTLINCFSDRKNVHFYTAHQHRRRMSYSKKQLPNIMEHNVPSICGNNWETAYNGYMHLCSDGTAPGFDVISADTAKLSWRYVSLMEGECPFRAYDMNAVKKYYTEDKTIRSFFKEYKNRTDYAGEGFENYIYVNYWGDEPGAKLEIFEDSMKLKVRPILHDDPSYTIAQAVFRFMTNRSKKPNVSKNACQHMFRAKCQKDSTMVVISAKDRFGRIYTDTLRRPVPFNFMQGIPRPKYAKQILGVK